ncbi:MAG: hypothetical protein KDA81_14885 [Planctomycetaceae bacterium]|nr:hypothetical protein [Planctomycetaceae bacterium]
MNQTMAWLLISQGLHLIMYAAAFVFVAGRPSDGSSAKSRALWAIGLYIGTFLFSRIAPIVLSQFFGAGGYAEIALFIQVPITIVNMIAFGLLVSAVFTGRSPQASADVTGFGAGVSDENPYSASQQ